LLALAASTVLAQHRVAPGSPFRTHAGPHSTKLADLNGDGKPDVISFNSAANNIQIFLGVGDGSFVEAPGSPITGLSHPVAGEVADFNGDGHTDIAVANFMPGGGGNSVTVLLGDGTGRFTPSAGSPYAAGGAGRQRAAERAGRRGIRECSDCCCSRCRQ
jgi:hypothetical protein